MDSDDDEAFCQTMRGTSITDEMAEAFGNNCNAHLGADDHALASESFACEEDLPLGAAVVLRDADYVAKKNGNFWEPFMAQLCANDLQGTVMRNSGRYCYVVFELNELIMGVTLHRRSFAIVGAAEASEQCAKAEEMLERGNAEGCVWFIAQMLSQPQDAQNFALFCTRSKAFLELGDATRALEDAMQSIKLQPSYAEAHVAAARAYRELGMEDEAGESFDRATQLDPHSDAVLAEYEGRVFGSPHRMA